MTSKPQRSRLGRGLNALLSGESDSASATSIEMSPVVPTEATPYRLVSVADIHVNPHQPRRIFDETDLNELAASLKANGLIQPIVVRIVDGAYQLIAGERRLRASKLAGIAQIPVLIRESDSYEQAQLALVENIHRTDLNPIERANAYQHLMAQLGLTQAELATRLGEQRSSIANYLRLLDLADAVRGWVAEGKISLGHAKLLAGVTDLSRQTHLAERCIEESLSVRALETLLQTPGPIAALSAAIVSPSPSNHFKVLEHTITTQLGLRVQMKPTAKKGKGRMVIHYSTLDEFDELMRRMQISLEETE